MLKEDNEAWVIAFALVAAAVSGMSGACAIIANKYLHGKKATFMAFLAYALIGSFTAIFLFGLYVMQGWVEPSIEAGIVYGGGSGLLVTLIVVSVNMGSRIILRFSGIEAEIIFKDTSKKKEG